ncbi:MAG: lipoate--protein ligase family protein [Candidatus Omnitrophota bacterium]
MKIIENVPVSPEEALAMDELFLLKAEKGDIGETLRFWQTDECFVVVGRSGKVEEECFLEKCRKDGIKILRRISGGGTVLQGKGCLNYSSVLSYLGDKRYEKIVSSYKKIMTGLSLGFRAEGLNAEFVPISDLAVGERKFSGNSQARKRRYFLHHGTILFDMDISSFGRYLKHPPKEPDYRNGREHRDFVANISFSPKVIKEVIRSVLAPKGISWQAQKKDLKGLTDLVECKYSRDSWNLCF